MKLHKSILAPIRATRDFSFLTRRRKSSSPSPFGKNRSLETATVTVEPSSPKVTCIGQVRVKSKRKSKQCRSLSCASRRGNFGDASFRKTDQGDVREYSRVCSRRRGTHPPRSRNQRWVHLPISICEALRGFGSDFCCFFHCTWRCQTSNKTCNGCWSCSCCGGNGRGCGAVFCRWLLCVSDGGGSRREIEVVVSGGDVETVAQEVRQRRHVFDDIEVRNGRIEVKGQSELEEEAPRVSICIPPENALLLMRCRSDPMKMAALANRISWAASASDFDNGDEFEQSPQHQDDTLEEAEEDRLLDQVPQENVVSIEPVSEMEVKIEEEEEEEEGEEVESNMSSFEALLDQETTNQVQDCPIQEAKEPEESDDKLATTDNPTDDEVEENELLVQVPEEEAEEEETMKKTEETQTPVLPDCLLLMMCEPKLSMEVSKETWVRGADFIRWLPPRKPAKSTKTTCCHHDPPPLKKAAKPTKPSLPPPPPPSKKNDHHHQPPRSSCSLPAAAASSMANMIEQKLAAGGAYGPFALPRCKSEPIRTAAAKLMPAEPYRVSTLGVGVGGAAGVIS